MQAIIEKKNKNKQTKNKLGAMMKALIFETSELPLFL